MNAPRESGGSTLRRISVVRNDRIIPLFPVRPMNTVVRSAPKGLLVEAHNLGPMEIPEHEHSSFCLTLQTGEQVGMEWWSEGRHGRESHRCGSMVLVTPGTRDRMRWDGPWRPVVVSIAESYLVRAAQELGCKNPLALTNRWNFQDCQLQMLMEGLRREMDHGWEIGSLYQDHIAMALSLTLIQRYSKETTISPIAKGGMSRVRLQRVLDYIDANSRQEITLNDLAVVAEMSRFHFARLFRLRMGVTPYRYVTEQRLENAKALLRCHPRALGEIARKTGFTNSAHFSRAFRRYVGVSPSEWIRHI
jgi:AraC family transcriptional regulator